MKTVEQAFAERQTIFASVAEDARGVLTEFCTKRGFLLVSRAKNIDSLRDKLETGRYADLESVDDAIAFSIVIDTTNQEEEVRRFLRRAFNVMAMKAGNTIQDERLFDFDSTRFYCTIEDKLDPKSEKSNVLFEVQIRTLLQHAWSKITHSHVYKAKIYDPRQGRLAAELMAQLESADRSFARFKTTAKTVKTVNRFDVTSSNSITAMIDDLVIDGIIPSELRPANGRRLGENIFESIRERRRNHAAAVELIKNFLVSQRGKFPRSVSLYQLAIVALHDARMLEHGPEKRRRRYYVTDDLISIFPSAAMIPNRVQIT